MQITRIDFRGSSRRPGHYATAQRHVGSANMPTVVVVTLLAPDIPNGQEHCIPADCEADLRSLAERLQHHLDGYEGSNSEVHDYFLELLRLSDL